jgi:hypothetical protein
LLGVGLTGRQQKQKNGLRAVFYWTERLFGLQRLIFKRKQLYKK